MFFILRIKKILFSLHEQRLEEVESGLAVVVPVKWNVFLEQTMERASNFSKVGYKATVIIC